MKTKIILFTLSICFCTIMFATAQTTTTGGDIKGSPYLKDAYSDGTIFFENNKRNAPIRYNAFKNQIEYKQDGIARVLDPTSSIKKVCFDSTTFVVEKYDDKGKTMSGYFELLDSGRINLYAKKVIKFIPTLKGRAVDGSDKPAEFKRVADELYYKVGDGSLQEVGSIKSVIASLPDKQEEISLFAKKEKISPRNPGEMSQLVKYYNSLQGLP